MPEINQTLVSDALALLAPALGDALMPEAQRVLDDAESWALGEDPVSADLALDLAHEVAGCLQGTLYARADAGPAQARALAYAAADAWIHAVTAKLPELPIEETA